MRVIATSLLILTLACGDDDGGGTDSGTDAATGSDSGGEVDSGAEDAGRDAAMEDAAMEDAGADAAMDDAGADASTDDAGADAAADAAMDAATDAAMDAGTDAAMDAGTDAAMDAGVDAGDPCAPNPCFAGVTCTPSGATFTCGACPAGMSGDGEVCASFAGLILNELDYDNEGTDSEEWVEIYNSSDDPIRLEGLELVLVNGATDTDYRRVELGTGELMAGAYLVVGPRAFLATLPDTVAKVAFPGDTNQIQNGAPDALGIIKTDPGEVVDVLSYEGRVEAGEVVGVGTFDFTEGDAPVVAIDTGAGTLARIPNGVDTGDSNADWLQSTVPTPGDCNTFCPAPAPTTTTTEGLVISEVDPIDDTVVLTNLTDSDIDMTTWQWCRRRSYSRINAVLPARTSMRFDLTLDDGSSDVGVYSCTPFGDETCLRAYVQYGGNGFRGRQAEADRAGLWPSGDFVEIPMCGGNQAIVAIGDVGNSDGWAASPSATACE
ncbi:MAG: lamin tail domain-containing protein [Myxococcota bacterium]